MIAAAIHSLSLTHFRNYERLSLEMGGRCVLLTGPNGAGKTNLLEAVSFLSPGRGLRRARLADIDRQGAGAAWTVAARVATRRGEVQIGTGRDAAAAEESDKRLVRIDGKPAKSQTELAEHLAVVWLTPQMDQLFTEGQSARRKFLDRLAYGFDTAHAGRVSAYEYAMRERNRLLSLPRADEHWIATLEQKMAETGAAMAAARLETVSHINAVMQCSALSFPKAELALTGLAEDRLSGGETALAVEAALADAFARSRHQDAAAGRTLVGPHRSELTVTHAEKRMEAALCSTGEQKALLLSIVLAEVRAAGIWRNVLPVLLLDEAVAHLDEARRAELFQEIESLGAQTWLTGTDLASFEGMRDKAHVFRVENGNVY